MPDDKQEVICYGIEAFRDNSDYLKTVDQDRTNKIIRTAYYSEKVFIYDTHFQAYKDNDY